MPDVIESTAVSPSQISAGAADKASLTTWIAIVAGMIGAFMALNIQITNASLLYIEELPRPLLKYAWQASLVEQPTLPGLGLQYCCSSCA